MDTQKIRLFLLLSILFVGGLLYSYWQAEHPKVIPAATPEPTAVAEQSTVNDIPTIAADALDANSAIPTAVPEVQVATAAREDLVHVKTDLFDIDIDINGGDIVGLALNKYPQTKDQPEPYALFDQTEARNYFAQSGLLSEQGPDSKQQGRALYKTTQSNFEMRGDKLIVPLTWQNNAGVFVTKQFTFYKNNYRIDVDYLIDNASGSEFNGRFYALLKRKQPPKAKGVVGMRTFTGAAIHTEEKPFKKIKFKEIQKQNLSEEVKGGWAAMTEHYFVSAWIPNENLVNHYFTKFNGNGFYQIGYYSPATKVAPNTTETIHNQLYAGPEITEQLEAAAPGLELTVDFGFLWPISIAILWVLKQIQHIVVNWGLSIILVTALIKLLFYRLSAASYRSMANMRKVQPKLQAIKEKYGDDRQGLSQAMMNLYKKEKINPLGGCLPILIQIPVFIGLYYVLLESVELRQAPFMLWITDLSAKDPFYVLPVLMGISMLLQQRLNPTPPDPLQAKMMMAMPIVFTVLFLQFPSGLVLYWFVNNSLSILQQWHITRKINA